MKLISLFSVLRYHLPISLDFIHLPDRRESENGIFREFCSLFAADITEWPQSDDMVLTKMVWMANENGRTVCHSEFETPRLLMKKKKVGQLMELADFKSFMCPGFETL
jgi:hypothetical protein